jgi:hypothetical protein
MLGKIYINDSLLYGMRRTIYTYYADLSGVTGGLLKAVDAVEM